MAYSTALEEEEEAGWQCCMPPRGSFGVLSRAQGAAEGVRSRDNPPPQPRPVEAPLGVAMSSPLGAPGDRSKLGRAPMGRGSCDLAEWTAAHSRWRGVRPSTRRDRSCLCASWGGTQLSPLETTRCR